MKSPKISVIVPVYNRERTVTACINSILQSEYKNIEVIVVDDGSIDNSLKICEELSAKDSRICVIHQDNAGVSAARNKGLDKATGDLISFVDSDDGIHPACYSTLFAGGHLDRCDLVLFGRGSAEYKHGKLITRKLSNYKEIDITGRDEIIDFLFKEYNPYKNKIYYIHDKIFRKSILDTHGIRFREDVSLGEDQIFVLDYLHHTERFHYTGKAFALNFAWNKREKQTSLGEKLRRPEEYLSFQKLNYEALGRLLEECNNEGLKKYQVNYILDRPISRIIFRYSLLQNLKLYPYGKLKQFTRDEIIPILQREIANASMMRNQRVARYAIDLCSKPLWRTFVNITIRQNLSYLRKRYQKSRKGLREVNQLTDRELRQGG